MKSTLSRILRNKNDLLDMAVDQLLATGLA